MPVKDKDRLNLYVSSHLKKGLEALADKERRSPSAQVEVLIEKALEEAYESGNLSKPQGSEVKATIDYETAVSILKSTSEKDQVRLAAIAETAQKLGLDGEKLLEACIDAGLKPKNGNGTAKKKEVNK